MIVLLNNTVNSAWIQQIEELINSLELFRMEEVVALNRITNILNAYGAEVSIEEMKDKETVEIKDIIKDEIKQIVKQVGR